MWSHCKVLPMTYVEKSEISFIINKLYHLDIAAMISNCLLYTTGQAARLVGGEREKEKPQTAEDNKGKGQTLPRTVQNVGATATGWETMHCSWQGKRIIRQKMDRLH